MMHSVESNSTASSSLSSCSFKERKAHAFKKQAKAKKPIAKTDVVIEYKRSLSSTRILVDRQDARRTQHHNTDHHKSKSALNLFDNFITASSLTEEAKKNSKTSNNSNFTIPPNELNASSLIPDTMKRFSMGTVLSAAMNAQHEEAQHTQLLQNNQPKTSGSGPRFVPPKSQDFVPPCSYIPELPRWNLIDRLSEEVSANSFGKKQPRKNSGSHNNTNEIQNTAQGRRNTNATSSDMQL